MKSTRPADTSTYDSLLKGGRIVPNTVRTCPKCGYQRQPGEQTPEHECPRCGVIYEKYQSVQGRQVNTPDRPASRQTRTKPGRAWPLWAKVGLPVLVLVVILAAWMMHSRPGPDGGAQATAPAAVKIKAYGYPLHGTWTGTLRDEYPPQGNLPPYAADYEASVTIGEDGKIEEIRWTDSHSPLTRVSLTWREDAVAVMGEERSHSNEALQEYLRVERRGNGLHLSYDRPEMLVLDLAIPEAFSKSADQAQIQRQADADSQTVTVPVRVLEETAWEVPSAQIARIVYKAGLAWALAPKEALAALSEADASSVVHVPGCAVPRTWVSCGGSGGPYLEFTMEQVTLARVPEEARKTFDPADILRLEPNTVMHLSAHRYERKAILRFTKAGQASLMIADKHLQPSGRPLVYALTKAG